jgi:hypothetical protein
LFFGIGRERLDAGPDFLDYIGLENKFSQSINNTHAWTQYLLATTNVWMGTPGTLTATDMTPVNQTIPFTFAHFSALNSSQPLNHTTPIDPWWVIMGAPFIQPLFKGIVSRLLFHNVAPLTSIFLHWITGTLFMFHLASFIGMIRKLLRRGLLW